MRPRASFGWWRTAPSEKRTAGHCSGAGGASGHCAGSLRALDRQPFEADLVALEETAQVGADGVPARRDDRQSRPVRFRRERLQPAQSLARQRSHFFREIAGGGDEGVILRRLDAHHARGFRSAIAAGERHSERKRNFADDRARQAPAEPPLDSVDRLDDFDLARKDREERPFAPLGDGKFAGHEMNVGGGLFELVELRARERREKRNGSDIVGRQHGAPGVAVGKAEASQLLSVSAMEVVIGRAGSR